LIRVLIVDDSIFMRTALAKMLESDPEIRVIDVARNGREAIEKIRRHRPDVVTMDILMPELNGLDALRIIQRDFSVPVLMVSSLTEEGAQATLEALSLGAFDYIPKGLNRAPVDVLQIQKELIAKVRAAYETKKRKDSPKPLLKVKKGGVQEPALSPSHPIEIMVIGASTGGPKAVQEIVTKLPGDFPIPILVVIHMPATFTRSYAERLNQMSNLKVVETEHGQALSPGTVYVARGGIHTYVRRSGDGFSVRLSPSPEDSLHRPSVDITMLSVAQEYGPASLGIILTGMGKDGLMGMKEIYRAGGITLAQDERSCVVYGMPRVCVEHNVVHRVVPLNEMARVIEKIVRASGSGQKKNSASAS